MASRYEFVKKLKELRFLFCHTSEHSAPLRAFLTRAYPPMKKCNPHIPILIREASGVEPRLFARYEFGSERQILLAGLTDKEIEDKVAAAVNAA